MHHDESFFGEGIVELTGKELMGRKIDFLQEQVLVGRYVAVGTEYGLIGQELVVQGNGFSIEIKGRIEPVEYL